MPDYSDFPELFIRNLEKLGFQTSLITNKIPAYKYRGSERLVNFIRKTFLKDKSYKKKLIAQFEETEYSRITAGLDEMFDYIFVIRPDSFPTSFIEKLKDKTTKYIGYQWDGIEKFPEVKNYFSFFNTFFCFETVPGFSNVKKTTNFYFDFDNYKTSNELSIREYNLQNEEVDANAYAYIVLMDFFKLKVDFKLLLKDDVVADAIMKRVDTIIENEYEYE